ncbi:MAG: peptidoglycan D,D-transpeptidase FtsI family protein [Candidatus Aminicenantales bacterium]
MSWPYQKKVKKRTIILTLFSFIWLIGIIFRLVQLQVIDHPRLKENVIDQNRDIITILPKRGTIYDRRGAILARSIPSYSVYYHPDKKEPVRLQLQKIDKLKRLLNLSDANLKTIKERIRKNAPFIWIKRKIDSTKVQKVRELCLNGIHFFEENKRFYPQGKRASFLLGRVDIDGTGQSGIERAYNSALSGRKGKRLILRDAKQREYHFEIIEEPKPGTDMILTIDETIQYIAEKELERTVAEKKAKWGTVIINEPSSGEILAMASCPSYDLNNLPSNPMKLDRNPAIHFLFDPGSTFKIITFAAALESESIDFSEEFDCSPGFIPVAGKKFRDHKKFGILSFPEIIIHSSNVGTIQVGQRVGRKRLYQTIKAFGFGQATGIDLPAEERGIFRSITSWSKLSMASLSIGYEISVTAIQMLQAINAVANGGVVTPPRIAKKILNSSAWHKSDPPRLRRVISEETARILSAFLEKVVEEGTGQAARIKGYRIIGKTGTAQKFDPSLKAYTSSSHISSFAGFVLIDKPVFSMIVVIDDPQGQYYGGQVAAPLFRNIALRLLQYLRIPPQDSVPRTIITAQTWRSFQR